MGKHALKRHVKSLESLSVRLVVGWLKLFHAELSSKRYSMIQGKMQTTLNTTLSLLQRFPLMPQCENLLLITRGSKGTRLCSHITTFERKGQLKWGFGQTSPTRQRDAYITLFTTWRTGEKLTERQKKQKS